MYVCILACVRAFVCVHTHVCVSFLRYLILNFLKQGISFEPGTWSSLNHLDELASEP